MPAKTKDKRIRRDHPEAQMELRNAAVDAALALYREQGLGALTMRAVAESVGVTPMALYRYFANKAELLRVVGEISMGELLAQTREALAPGMSARERILTATRVFIGFWESNPDHYRVVYMESPGSDSPLNAPRLSDTAVYQEMLALGLEQIQDLADELGAGRHNVALARDLRLTVLLGYLQASMVLKRYPWRDMAALRERVVDVAVNAAAECLLDGS